MTEMCWCAKDPMAAGDARVGGKAMGLAPVGVGRCRAAGMAGAASSSSRIFSGGPSRPRWPAPTSTCRPRAGAGGDPHHAVGRRARRVAVIERRVMLVRLARLAVIRPKTVLAATLVIGVAALGVWSGISERLSGGGFYSDASNQTAPLCC